jgi:vesicle transport through interaction with t-SNAREs protein 1
MPSEEYAYYVRELRSVLEKLSAATGGGSGGASALSECPALLQESKEHLHNAQLEARMAESPAEKKQLLADLEDLKRQLEKHKFAFESANLRAGASAGSNPDNQQVRSRIEESNTKLARQNEILESARRTAAETESIGTDIMGELRQNREKIEKAQGHVGEMEADMNDADGRINRMQRREKCSVM